MSCPDHRDYYLARAATARELAERAADPQVAAIHTDFATRYDELAAKPDCRNPATSTAVQAA